MDTIVIMIAALSTSACLIIASQRLAAAREKLAILRVQREQDLRRR